MAQERWMRKVGNSWVVAVPQRVREHLGLKHSNHLYWHITGPKEVVLSPLAQRIGGRPPGLALSAELDAARRRIIQLEAALKAQPAAVLAEARMQEWMRRLRLEIKGYPAIDAINDRLRAIEARLGVGRPARPLRPGRRFARTEAVPGPDTYPQPDPPPSPGVVEEGAATSGAPLPGGPLRI